MQDPKEINMGFNNFLSDEAFPVPATVLDGFRLCNHPHPLYALSAATSISSKNKKDIFFISIIWS